MPYLELAKEYSSKQGDNGAGLGWKVPVKEKRRNRGGRGGGGGVVSCINIVFLKKFAQSLMADEQHRVDPIQHVKLISLGGYQ